MAIEASVNSLAEVTLRQIDEASTERILDGYAVLQQALGYDAVEDLDSFLGTISTSTDDAVVPKIVCALRRDVVVGIIVGQYLRNLNMGFIAYAGVSVEWRRRGVYSALRHKLIGLFTREAATELDKTGSNDIAYVISELDEDGWLYQTYLDAWNGVALPCDYEQPCAQGLQEKSLRLVLRGVGARTSLCKSEIATIVREIYKRVYRIESVEDNPSYRRVVASLRNMPINAR